MQTGIKIMRNLKNKMKKLSRSIWSITKKSFSDFIDNKVLKLSAALAYYTIFSLAPILILVIALLDKFYKREAIEGKIYGQISSFVGHDAALQIQDIIACSAFESHRTGM